MLAKMARHDGQCQEFEQQLGMHRLSQQRPGNAELLARF